MLVAEIMDFFGIELPKQIANNNKFFNLKFQICKELKKLDILFSENYQIIMKLSKDLRYFMIYLKLIAIKN